MQHPQRDIQLQVSPLPTGPSFKKPFTILVPILDDFYRNVVLTLITLIGTGRVFGEEQPINFRFIFDNHIGSLSPLFLSSGFSIPNTIRIFSPQDVSTEENALSQGSQQHSLLFRGLDLIIFATRSESLLTSFATTISSHITQLPHAKVFIIAPNVVSACEKFQATSRLPPQVIHGFALHYESLFLSQLITQINKALFDQKLEAEFPFIDIQSVKNIFLSAHDPVQSQAGPIDLQPKFDYNITHALLSNYPIPGRITPLVAVVSRILPKFKLISTNLSLPPIEQQVNSPLSPFSLLISQALQQWFGFTQQGVFFTACIADSRPNEPVQFHIKPISTYYGNTSTSKIFKPQTE
jgi:hypothetical protein